MPLTTLAPDRESPTELLLGAATATSSDYWPPPPPHDEERATQSPTEVMEGAEAVEAGRLDALRAGDGAWFERTDLRPNDSRRWIFRYTEDGGPPGPDSPEEQWERVADDIAGHLFESALSFTGPFRNAHIPLYAQEMNLSCEAATLRMVLGSYGIEVSEEEIRALIPHSDNPHEGFVGEYGGGFGGVDNYGVYAEPLVDVFAHYGLEARVSYGMSYAELDRLVKRGDRVVVWLTKWNEGEREHAVLRRGDSVVAEFHGHQHVAVVVGRDAAGRWVLHDPYPAGGIQPGVEQPGQIYICSIIPNWEAFHNPTDPDASGRMALVVSGPRD